MASAMARRTELWSPTGGLFAVTASIFILAVMMLAGLLMPARYRFAPRALGRGGQAVWRGDTITGHAELFATDITLEALQSNDATKTIARKC